MTAGKTVKEFVGSLMDQLESREDLSRVAKAMPTRVDPDLVAEVISAPRDRPLFLTSEVATLLGVADNTLRKYHLEFGLGSRSGKYILWDFTEVELALRILNEGLKHKYADIRKVKGLPKGKGRGRGN